MMKRFLLSLTLLLPYGGAWAQADAAALIPFEMKQISINMSQLGQTLELVSQGEEMLRNGQQVKYEIERMVALQAEIREKMQSGASIRDLPIMDFMQMATTLERLKAGQFLGGSGEWGQSMSNALQAEDVKILFRAMRGMTSARNGRELFSEMSETFRQQYQYEKKMLERDQALAIAYQQFSEEALHRAKELEALVKADCSSGSRMGGDCVEMTDGERLEIGMAIEGYYEKALEFQNASAELISGQGDSALEGAQQYRKLRMEAAKYRQYEIRY